MLHPETFLNKYFYSSPTTTLFGNPTLALDALTCSWTATCIEYLLKPSLFLQLPIFLSFKLIVVIKIRHL